jgi:hypothetical protein
MKNEDFIKSSKVTYIKVVGTLHGYVVATPNESSQYSGFIEVPYSYEEFTRFNENQRKAICQAELSKAGLCVKIKICDIDAFFEEQSE